MLERDHAERVQVGLRRDLGPDRLIRGHVGGRADHEPGLGEVLADAPERLGDPEVRDLDAAVGGDEQVLRLEIAMHDAGVVGVREPGQYRLQHAGDLRDRGQPDVAPQRPALEVLHCDVGRAVVLEEPMDRDDVRMPQRAGDARLREEALDQPRIRGPQVEFLERDVAVQAGLVGEIDDRHPAADS
ncbi:hypothetical protein OM076_09745 [Solirubrobacter ginsenosidimutans]|uniref:Uncharacterized protein n=1 Tax=Solirubrobacter ginsenosidimutans TaxID=490573 RepID=A0A9X3S1W4_9ACTN|nr:hypothetical protein [Solirubrobacter ginsenosidimutans]MDA0160546.1 hypothetical protein [Solirubrobacter ginsenosidimutans]